MAACRPTCLFHMAPVGAIGAHLRRLESPKKFKTLCSMLQLLCLLVCWSIVLQPTQPKAQPARICINAHRTDRHRSSKDFKGQALGPPPPRRVGEGAGLEGDYDELHIRPFKRPLQTERPRPREN